MSPYQIVSLFISIMIVLGALVSMWLCPVRRYRHLIWLVFGAIGVVFYVYVELVYSGSHIWSPIRTLAQYTLVAVWIWMWNIKNWRERK